MDLSFLKTHRHYGTQLFTTGALALIALSWISMPPWLGHAFHHVGTGLVLVGMVYLLWHDGDGFCGLCFETMPENPGKQAERRRLLLRLHHFVADKPEFVIGVYASFVFTLVLAASLPHRTSGHILNDLVLLCFSYALWSDSVHARLRLWCPGCPPADTDHVSGESPGPADPLSSDGPQLP